MDVRKMLVPALCVLAAGCTVSGQLNSSSSQAIPPEGICLVGVWVEKDGSVADAQLVKSTGVPSIDADCLNAIRGREVAQQIVIDPFLFNLGTIRRYAVVQLRWHQASRPRETATETK